MSVIQLEAIGIGIKKNTVKQNLPPFIDVKLALSAANTERWVTFRISNDPETIMSFTQARDEVDKIDKTMFTWLTYSRTAFGIFLSYGFAPER